MRIFCSEILFLNGHYIRQGDYFPPPPPFKKITPAVITSWVFVIIKRTSFLCLQWYNNRKPAAMFSNDKVWHHTLHWETASINSPHNCKNSFYFPAYTLKFSQMFIAFEWLPHVFLGWQCFLTCRPSQGWIYLWNATHIIGSKCILFLNYSILQNVCSTLFSPPPHYTPPPLH